MFSHPLGHQLDWHHANKAAMMIHYNDVIMGAMASQITSLTIVYSTVYSGADQRKYQSSASLAFVRGIHRWPVKSPHKGPVTRKMFPFNDVIMKSISAIWLMLLWIFIFFCLYGTVFFIKKKSSLFSNMMKEWNWQHITYIQIYLNGNSLNAQI